jgi:hypothetical protein
VEGLGGAAGDAARALVTGIPLTKEAAAANLFANDAIRQNTMAIQEGKRATEGIVDTQDALAQGTKTYGKQIMYAGDAIFGGIGVQAYDTAAIIQKEGKTRQQRLEEVEKAQKKQSEASGELTEDFTKAQLATANSSKNLQSLGFSLAKAAVPAVKLFAETLDKATGYINQKFGLGGRVPTRPTEDTGGAGGGGGGASVNPGRSVTVGGQTRTGGDRNWRNNNPGNIEYGPFAIKYGAIGSDGRFAIFPSEEQGRMAQDALLKSKNYANLSLADAVKRYAPSNENDPKSYANQIMKSTGIDTSKTYASLTPEEQGKVLDAMKRIEGGRAGSISGPSSQNQNNMAGVNPSSAGSTTTAQGERASEEQQSGSINSRLFRQLVELNQTSKDLLIVNKKILARQS